MPSRFYFLLLALHSWMATSFVLPSSPGGRNDTIATDPTSTFWPSPDEYRKATSVKLADIAFFEDDMGVYSILDDMRRKTGIYFQEIGYHTSKSFLERHHEKIAIQAHSPDAGEEGGWKQLGTYTRRYSGLGANDKTFGLDEVKFTSIDAIKRLRDEGCTGLISGSVLEYGKFAYRQDVLRNLVQYVEPGPPRTGHHRLIGAFVDAKTGMVALHDSWGPWIHCNGSVIERPASS